MQGSDPKPLDVEYAKGEMKTESSIMGRSHNSTFYFIGKLCPDEWCHRYNPGEIHVENGWTLDIFHNGISLWNSKVSSKFDSVGTYAKDALETIVTLFNFLSDSKLKCKIENWVEAKKFNRLTM